MLYLRTFLRQHKISNKEEFQENGFFSISDFSELMIVFGDSHF